MELWTAKPGDFPNLSMGILLWNNILHMLPSDKHDVNLLLFVGWGRGLNRELLVFTFCYLTFAKAKIYFLGPKMDLYAL